MNEAIRKLQLCADGLMELYSTLNETEPEAVYATLLGLHQLADEALALLKEPPCQDAGVGQTGDLKNAKKKINKRAARKYNGDKSQTA